MVKITTEKARATQLALNTTSLTRRPNAPAVQTAARSYNFPVPSYPFSGYQTAQLQTLCTNLVAEIVSGRPARSANSLSTPLTAEQTTDLLLKVWAPFTSMSDVDRALFTFAVLFTIHHDPATATTASDELIHLVLEPLYLEGVKNNAFRLFLKEATDLGYLTSPSAGAPHSFPTHHPATVTAVSRPHHQSWPTLSNQSTLSPLPRPQLFPAGTPSPRPLQAHVFGRSHGPPALLDPSRGYFSDHVRYPRAYLR